MRQELFVTEESMTESREDWEETKAKIPKKVGMTRFYFAGLGSKPYTNR